MMWLPLAKAKHCTRNKNVMKINLIQSNLILLYCPYQLAKILPTKFSHISGESFPFSFPN